MRDNRCALIALYEWLLASWWKCYQSSSINWCICFRGNVCRRFFIIIGTQFFVIYFSNISYSFSYIITHKANQFVCKCFVLFLCYKYCVIRIEVSLGFNEFLHLLISIKKNINFDIFNIKDCVWISFFFRILFKKFNYWILRTILTVSYSFRKNIS